MGEVFAGRYELVDPIGRGGAGAVWRAWDHRRRRYVAAKVLLQSDAHTLLRFVREQALRIDHPHVLAPASWAADDDKVLFTMDLVAGGSLAHVLGDYGPLPPRFVCVLLDQLLSALAAVHAEGVVHRDIKPANILLDATGTGRPHLRLSDFGIAMRKGEPRLTETDYVVGTPGYFAPEQLLGAEPDFPSDLFAVGLVALYLLQGRKPDFRALVEDFVAHGTPSAPEGVPEPLWQVLAGLLRPDPQSRFRTATGARKALGAAVELLPDPDPAEEPVEIFDQLGPLPPGFGPAGPEKPVRSGDSTGFTNSPAPAASARAEGPSAPESHPGHTSPTGPGHPIGPETPAAPVPAPEPATPPAPGPSGTGSFLLPPPTAPPAPAPAVRPASAPAPAFGPAPLVSSPYEQPPAPPYSGPPYTAYPAQSPAPPPGFAPSPGFGPPVSVPARRPGPPPKVAVPVLLLALVCLAVGFWALARI
ncbi:serine/threonine-protein kinase [Streptomyces sp. NPDC001744]|uniref:serine/threonine-protein kinase n=1 Tax=Streptomyces sp. NPDC001744 TaxID=3364606 RepID=UPI0036A015BA